jgi:hypothetical protein
MNYKGIFGTLSVPGRYVHLAQFELSSSSETAIVECMRQIEEAIATEAKICDLSAVGHAEAWGDAWNIIDW